MEHSKSRLAWLFYRYQNNICTSEERKEFLELVADSENHEEINRLLGVAVEESEADMEMNKKKADEVFAIVLNTVEKNKMSSIVIWPRFRKIAVAASVALIVGLGLYSLLPGGKPHVTAVFPEAKKTKNDAMPGGNKAVLTLADGSQIILDSAKDGIITKQGNVKVIKLNNGQIVYNGSSNQATEVQYNTINTPKGGQYKIILSDGTEAWLNAASAIRYPTAFSGTSREVEISGEVYFEVTKNKHQPFTVKKMNDASTIQVLGTHFNVNAYDDETEIRVTLLEGKVKVAKGNDQNILKPGQQARIINSPSGDGTIKVLNNVDLDEIMAWKNGKFDFGEKASIEDIMLQMARWYNIEVEYKGKVTQHFCGTISRNVNASQVFKMLEATGGVKFKMEGNKVIVRP
ncbi:FecR family protein [Chitinophagaceae bacterium 26-R-25]|nr:FecR family protein [Chitinophagaceae bacterium 26-R-25]